MLLSFSLNLGYRQKVFVELGICLYLDGFAIYFQSANSQLKIIKIAIATVILFLILKGKKIDKELNSIFVRYDPDLKKFCTFRIINEIFASINTKHTHTHAHTHTHTQQLAK